MSNLPSLSVADGLDGPSIYYSNLFRTQIECHLPLLQSQIVSSVIAVTPADADSFRGDFYGLLIQYKIPRQYHWITLRLNGMKSPDEYDGETLNFWLADQDFLTNLANVVNATASATAQA